MIVKAGKTEIKHDRRGPLDLVGISLSHPLTEEVSLRQVTDLTQT
jgi:hypothetical protein